MSGGDSSDVQRVATPPSHPSGEALIGAEYPCAKGELPACASTNEAGAEVKKALNALPGGTYTDADAVLAALEASGK